MVAPVVGSRYDWPGASAGTCSRSYSAVSGACAGVASGRSVGSGTLPPGAVTVTLVVPLRPSLVAVIVARPGASPSTRPVVTGATLESLLAQATTRPASGVPCASSGTAVSWTLWPTGTTADPGLTATEATDRRASGLAALRQASATQATHAVATPKRHARCAIVATASVARARQPTGATRDAAAADR